MEDTYLTPIFKEYNIFRLEPNILLKLTNYKSKHITIINDTNLDQVNF